MSFLNTLLKIGNTDNKEESAIVRISYGRLGQALEVEIKISSGDSSFDLRALEHVKNSSHAPLHHPGKNKKRRAHQWYEIRYVEN